MAQAEIYTAKVGQPPLDDEGPTPPALRKRKPKMMGDVYTADKGNPPMDYEGPTTPAMPKKGKALFSKGGSVSSASKRADGCAVKGKTKGRMM